MIYKNLKSVGKKLIPSVYISIANTIKKNTNNKKEIKVLDIGGGEGKYWIEIRNEISKEAIKDISVEILDPNPSHFWTEVDVEGLDITIRNGFAPESLFYLPDNCFDIVLALDVIEHLDRSNGYHLIYEIERISKFSAVLFTPNGYVWQPPAPDNKFNAHISGWKPSEFASMPNWKVYGASGFKFLYGPFALPKYSYLSIIIGGISQKLTYYLPSIAFSYLAVFKK